MKKFFVVEVEGEAQSLDLTLFLLQKNYAKVSILNRIQDHPYLLRHQQETAVPQPIYANFSNQEKQQLAQALGLISTPDPDEPSDTMSPSAAGNSRGFRDDHLRMHHVQHVQQQIHIQHGHPQQIQQNDMDGDDSRIMNFSSDSQMTLFDQVKNEVEDNGAVIGDGHLMLPNTSFNNMDMDLLEESHFDAAANSTMALFATQDRKRPRVEEEKTTVKGKKGRAPENIIKQACNLCNHVVTYSPQRIWNLMRHIWICHPSKKPNKCSMCDYEHIRSYVSKHIETVHKSQGQDAFVIDQRSAEMEVEWNQMISDCFGVSYRKWKHLEGTT